MVEKNYYHDKFIVEVNGLAYAFFVNDMNHPHPGIFLLADSFEDYTPHIVYLENSDNVADSVEKLKNDPNLCDCISNCILGVAITDDREKLFNEIWGNLGYIPKCNELQSRF